MAFASIQGRLAPLITPNLRWYWLNAIVSAFGDSVTTIALTLMVLLETGSLSLMATMSIVVIVPGIIFGILSATWVDRWDARRVIVVSQIARALLILGLVYADVSDHLWIAFVLAACQSLVGTFDDPARARMIQTITDDATRLCVNSLTSSGVMIAVVARHNCRRRSRRRAGCLLARICRQQHRVPDRSRSHLSYPWQLCIDASSYGYRERGVAILGRCLGGSPSDPLLTGPVRGSHGASAANLGLGAATIMLTPLIVDVLHVQPAWFGVVEGAQTAAAILVSLAIGVYGSMLDPRRLIVICMIMTGIVASGIGLTVNIWTLLTAMFLVGITITPLGACFGTLLQTHAPKAMIGRVATTMSTCIQTSSVASMAIARILGDAIGVRPVFWLAGIICVIAGILAGVLFRHRAVPPQAGAG